jgi:integrase
MAVSHSRRSNGEGSVYRTAEGRWRASLMLTHPDGLRRVRRVVSGRSRAEVVRKLDALKREGAAGWASGDSTGDYLEHWIEAVRPRLRPATHREYARHVRGYLAPLADVPLTALTPGHVERLLAGMLERGLSPMTAAHARATLRRALHDAQRDGLVSRNVAGLARPPRVTRQEMHPLTAPQVRGLIEATRDDPLGPVWALAVGSGLRLGEMLGLTWTDIDLDTGQLVVRRAMARAADGGWSLAEPKTSRSRRTVMLPAIAHEALRRRRAQQDADQQAAGTAWQDRGGLVFTDAVGRPLRPPDVSDEWRRTRRRVGVTCRLHDLRHTAATLMLGAGVPLKVVSDALGHSTIAITADTYAHVTPELRREAAAAMDRALGGAA